MHSTFLEWSTMSPALCSDFIATSTAFALTGSAGFELWCLGVSVGSSPLARARELRLREMATQPVGIKSA